MTSLTRSQRFGGKETKIEACPLKTSGRILAGISSLKKLSIALRIVPSQLWCRKGCARSPAEPVHGATGSNELCIPDCVTCGNQQIDDVSNMGTCTETFFSDWANPASLQVAPF